MRKVFSLVGWVFVTLLSALYFVLMPVWALIGGIAYVALSFIGVICGLAAVLLYFIELRPYEWVWPAVIAAACIPAWFLIAGAPLLINLLMSFLPGLGADDPADARHLRLDADSQWD